MKRTWPSTVSRIVAVLCFFFSSRRRHTRCSRDWSSDVCSSDLRNERYLHGGSFDCDLTVIPLCLDGDRAAIYHHPPSPAVLVHDWIWRVRGSGTIVSAVLLKRLNLVRQ